MIQQQDKGELTNQIRFVSHEIRNHLSICDMYSLIIKKNLEKGGIENSSIENAVDCIQKSLQIINANLLELKSLNQNCAKLFDFKNTVLIAVELAKAYVEDKNIEFEVFIKNSANILIDENKFQACIVNIIKNGIEAICLSGKIAVFGEVKDNKAILRISNNGKPIPKDKQEQIFTQGYTTKNSGSGLGLSICKKYLQSQNAVLRLVKSNRSETTFETVIPVV